jgi:hypothetical protein
MTAVVFLRFVGYAILFSGALSLPATGWTAEENYGAALSKRLGVHAVHLDVDGKPAFILMPPTDKQQTPQPWIMYPPRVSR